LLNVEGVIICGPGSLKDCLAKESKLDERITKKILSVVDVAYGGHQGLHEGIAKSSSVLQSCRILEEKKIIQSFLQSLASGEGKAAIGLSEVSTALELGAVATVLISQSKENSFYTQTSSEKVRHVQLKTGKDKDEKANGTEADLVPLVRWLSDHKVEVEVLEADTPEGSQFAQGLGGIGALLKYPLRFDDDIEEEIEDEEFFEEM